MEQLNAIESDVLPPGAAVTAQTASTWVSSVRFLAWSLGVVAAGALLVMAFIAIVDPYRLFGWVDVPGFNHVKPSPEQYREQIKVAQAAALRPNFVLLGNSRIEIGIDPDGLALRTHGYSAYNLGLSGTAMDTSRRAAERLRAAAPAPATAVIGVEFLDFLVAPGSPRRAAAPVISEWEWRFNTLFSLTSLMDAAGTLRLQHVAEPQTMTARGHDPLLDYRRHAREEGYHAIFEQRARDYAKTFVSKPHNLVASDGSSANLDHLRGMLDAMARDGTAVHLVIYPYHAQAMAMLEEAGLAPTMDAWKTMLVHEVEAVRRRHPGARVALWDFSGYGDMRCERIPGPGDTHATTRWYWEAGHFKPALGERILARILGEDGTFGVPLAAANIDANRQRMAAERAHCAAAYPDVFADARKLVEAARAQP